MPVLADNLRVDGARLWRSLEEMAQIGPGVAGGNNRQTLTDEDGEARALFARWCAQANLELGVDRMGTMFATRAGTDPDALPVYVGSRLDTQPTGGRFDGMLGVLAGLEIVRTLNDLGIATKHPIVVTNWTNEEGTRFAPAMIASGVFAGVHDLEWAHDRTDGTGARLGAELARIGWLGDEPAGARKMHAYFELHIEQGPILEAEECDIGVVTHSQGLSWTELTVTGTEAHTGSTPMAMRGNAGLGMARIVGLVNEIAWSHAPDAVGAVGKADLYPNSRNVIPGRAVFTVDFRSPDVEILSDMERRLGAGAQDICDELGLTLGSERIGGFEPVAFDLDCVARVRDVAGRLGYSHRDIVSGAGHDACWIARIAPSAMIMCPCVGGLSHNEAELILPRWATAGAEVLLHAVVDTARVVNS